MVLCSQTDDFFSTLGVLDGTGLVTVVELAAPVGFDFDGDCCVYGGGAGGLRVAVGAVRQLAISSVIGLALFFSGCVVLLEPISSLSLKPFSEKYF